MYTQLAPYLEAVSSIRSLRTRHAEGTTKISKYNTIAPLVYF
jgi:hypothetical protein